MDSQKEFTPVRMVVKENMTHLMGKEILKTHFTITLEIICKICFRARNNRRRNVLKNI